MLAGERGEARMNDPMIGRTIGRYRIAEHLGRGGMAEVYKAYQPNLDRYVAIKMLHTFLSDEKEFLTRFEREAKVVATLRHPNIVQVYDFDVEGGVYYMVMEYISGEALKTRLQRLEANGEWVSPDDAARIILAVGSALKYAHERGMVHRDVKPANVMITLDGQVILTDFGIAKIVSASNITASGAMVGTPSYMAPEQGMGQPGDERSDIYSLGVMLYQLVLGRLPFDADTPLAVVLKHINEPLPPPKALKPDISEELNQVILKTLAKNPGDRYQKVADLTADLRRVMGMSPEDSQPDAAKGSGIKLAGATMVGRVGSGVTPLPRPVPVAAPQDQVGTQVAAPKTVVAEVAVSSSTPATTDG
jgi:serine/threonine protein kinase